MRRSEEIELKFSFEDGDALARLARRDISAAHGVATPGGRIEITDRYFDTADEALKQAGYGARLRTVGLGHDADSESGHRGRARRCTGASSSRRRRRVRSIPKAWPDSEARSRLVEVVGARRLIERFVIGQERRERAIELDGTRALASIDEGEVEYLGLRAGELRQFRGRAARRAIPRRCGTIARRVAASGLGTAEEHSKMRARAGDGRGRGARRARRSLVRRRAQAAAPPPRAHARARSRDARRRRRWRSSRCASRRGACAQRGASSAAHSPAATRAISTPACATSPSLLGTVRDLDVLLETVAGNATRSRTWPTAGARAATPRSRS